jgi:hypothetical protein
MQRKKDQVNGLYGGCQGPHARNCGVLSSAWLRTYFEFRTGILNGSLTSLVRPLSTMMRDAQDWPKASFCEPELPEVHLMLEFTHVLQAAFW